jgi:hypothetical protein
MVKIQFAIREEMLEADMTPQGFFITCQLYSSLIVQNSNFENGIGLSGGAIYVKSNLNIFCPN